MHHLRRRPLAQRRRQDPHQGTHLHRTIALVHRRAHRVRRLHQHHCQGDPRDRFADLLRERAHRPERQPRLLILHAQHPREFLPRLRGAQIDPLQVFRERPLVELRLRRTRPDRDRHLRELLVPPVAQQAVSPQTALPHEELHRRVRSRGILQESHRRMMRLARVQQRSRQLLQIRLRKVFASVSPHRDRVDVAARDVGFFQCCCSIH